METKSLKYLTVWQMARGPVFACLLLTTCYLLLATIPAEAATFYFQPLAVKVGVGDSIRVEFIMDSPENVNAVEGKISFPGDLLEAQNINDAGSVVTLWIQRPTIIGGQIAFSGAIPGGYPAFGGHLFSVDFKAKKAGIGSVSAGSISALLNDGQGSNATVVVKKLSVVIGSVATGVSAPAISDNVPPENFQLVIASDPNLFDGQKFISFATQDKGSGLDYYATLERRTFFKPNSENWQKSVSPYLLKDQELKSWVGVRAVDNNGNIRTVWIIPHWVIVYRYLLTIGFGIIAIIVLGLVIRARRKSVASS